MDIEIIGCINLILESYDLENLHQQLKKLYRPEYKSNQKIVIIHNDHEYFFHRNTTGVTTHNFFTLVRNVDIPLSALIILTTHTRYKESIQHFISHYTDAPEVHSLLVSDQTYRLILPWLKEPIDSNKNIKFNGLCILGTVRSHRIKMAQFLNVKNYDTIQYNFNNKLANLLSRDTKQFRFIDPEHSELAELGIIYTVPHGTNQNWASVPRHPEIEMLANQPVPLSKENSNIPSTGIDFYKNYAVDIITETNFDYPHVFISEKTLRAILCYTPFLIIGPAGTLEYLKSLGFHTFADVWDETYDTIEDPQERFMACLKVLDEIAGWSLEKATEVYTYLKPRTEQNRKILIDYIDNTFLPVYNKFKVPLEK